jgi:hypothetical protein
MNNNANVKMSEITHEEFKKVCKLQGLKMSEVINEYARKHIRDYYSLKNVFENVSWDEDIYISNKVEVWSGSNLNIELTNLWYNFETYFPTIYKNAQKNIYLTFTTFKEYEEYEELAHKVLMKMRGGKTLNRVFVYISDNQTILNPKSCITNE